MCDSIIVSFVHKKEHHYDHVNRLRVCDGTSLNYIYSNCISTSDEKTTNWIIYCEYSLKDYV